MDPSESPAFLPVIAQRFQSIIWSCLDSDLTGTAVFYAERYFALDQHSHDARHLYATSLLREGQTYPALCVVDISRQDQCSGCLELKAKCCNILGRYRQAREALEEASKELANTPSTSTSTRTARQSPDLAAMHCRSGAMALKGNLQSIAANSFRQALSMNPLIWEAFEGLCALGSIPEIDELFPPLTDPVKHITDEATSKPSGPVATGAGFFTPEAANAANLFRGFKPEVNQLQPFRIPVPPLGPRDSLASNESSFRFADTTFQQAHRISRSQTTVPGSTQHVTRPLSSADEAGPMPKKLRSTAPQHALKPSKPLKLPIEDPLKKPLASSKAGISAAKSIGVNNVITRRSTRLLSGAGSKHSSKALTRDRRKQQGHARSRSVESDEDGEVANSPSPPGMTSSPRSEKSPSPWTLGQEQAAQATYEIEVADKYIYDLMRQFARVIRALSMYDSQQCLNEVELLPHIQQRTPWVLSVVGRAHYDKGHYVAAERAFKAVRTLEPYRLWDMEVYSTLLWHLQRPVELSFLAQELLNIDPRSPQAWIAIGNLFSLQKERAQALTCFRRATQMDPSCAYAYTLSGHETIDEDLEKAVTFFQSALRVDPRHYNAWYGLGTCYLRMSKLRLAEYHFRKAVEIHPKNAVLLGCVGMVVERRGDQEGARALFDKAVGISPENALVRYRRAKILISVKEYKAAIKDLEQLHNTSPDESNVVFQLAKVYRLMGDEVKSAQFLAIARDISPKSIGKIKKLLDTAKDESGDDRMDEG
ncbi:hypothetical protein GYMLUDRAFT_44345 [Collybiopsis luxurians FD-317 M1]|uniref:Unplaced genomic scaffold GYMLUscaffold_30, whole genome shotgun sequence n=1 Tax=Collybiopsis luxurians FD-317 M1 TaxID=944289 RepID=A0A0D0CBK0_9AGAR|nr:hypothetical protein GYMLUDRAFT_44345 [Collybiopsis luxurians FD-317 M1]